MKRGSVVLGSLLSLLVLAGVALASIPGPDGVIHGCYKTSNPATGSVIVIDSAASCPSGFAALNWNQTGPQGPAGVSGYETVQASASPGTGTIGTVTATCPAGKKVVGGGFDVSAESDPSATILSSRPGFSADPPPREWMVVFDTRHGFSGTVMAYAICVTVT